MSDSNEFVIEASGAGVRKRVTAKCGGQIVHVDVFDLASATSRQKFAKAASEKMPAVPAGSTEEELCKLAAEDLASAEAAAADAAGQPSAPQDEPAARAEAEQMLRRPGLLSLVLDDVRLMGVAGERKLTATVYLVGVSRLLEDPLASIVQGASSSGKSYVVGKVAELFPPEALIVATQMTPQALFHMPPGSLAHRFVVGGERSRLENDDTAEATRALREMLSGGRLSKLMPVKAGSSIETQLIEQEGPIAFVETTTLTNIFAEDLNRCILVQTDEGHAQTLRVLAQAGAAAAGDGAPPEMRDRVRLRHHALQRMLRPHRVVVPYAGQLSDLFGERFRRVEARRALPHLLGLIKAITLLHQFQRQPDDQGRLVATVGDYGIARTLLAQPLAQQNGALAEAPRRFHAVIACRRAVGETFTTTEAKRWETSAPKQVYGWLPALAEHEAVELVEEGKGQRPARWRLTKAELDDAPWPACRRPKNWVQRRRGRTQGCRRNPMIAKDISVFCHARTQKTQTGTGAALAVCVLCVPEGWQTLMSLSGNGLRLVSLCRGGERGRAMLGELNPDDVFDDDLAEQRVRRLLNPRADELPLEWHYAWEERAAIMEYDGGLPRERAEALALTAIHREMRRTGDRHPPEMS